MEPQGKMTFYCPYCGQKLSFLEGTLIKMVGRLHATTFSCKTMFYFSAQLGQYGCIVGEGVRVYDGAKVEYECINTACKKNFTSPHNDELAEISATDEDFKEFKVVFNKVFGKRSTFLLDMAQSKLVESFGVDKDDYISDPEERRRNFFGE
jgi:hypothetical protein